MNHAEKKPLGQPQRPENELTVDRFALSADRLTEEHFRERAAVA